MLATHLSSDDRREFPHDPQFPLTLVFNRSHHRYSEPWYYGVNHGMAVAMVFRPADSIRMSPIARGRRRRATRRGISSCSFARLRSAGVIKWSSTALLRAV